MIASRSLISVSLLALVSQLSLAQIQTNSSGALPAVDLGYTIHQASSKVSSMINRFIAGAGYQFDIENQNGIYNFTNIRYAQPPIGDLRFQPPVAPSEQSQQVDNGGPVPIVCYQASSGLFCFISVFLNTSL